jgi:membrane fusion protein (multidrug efflux system)
MKRNVHPGALVGPGTGSTPLLRLHQVSRLRLVVAVPEALVGAMVKGARVPFAVPAYPGETFYGAEPHGPRSR